MIRKTILFVGLMFSLIFVTSCVTTTMLWNKEPYEEQFSTFYLTTDNKNLAILGEKYHYIFTVDANLQKIISWKHNNILIIDSTHRGTVDENNKINISYEFSVLLKNVSKEDEIWLKANKFRPEILTNGKALRFAGYLSGIRYIAKNSPKNMVRNDFKNLHTAYIWESFSDTQRLARQIVSPVTILVDGTILLGAIPFAATNRLIK